MITAFVLPPASAWTRRSMYLKIRDRDSYAFALASAAVGLALEDGQGQRGADRPRRRRHHVPWRAHRAEAALRGQVLTEEAAQAAAEAEFSPASIRHHNRYKRSLGPATLVRALLALQALEA